MRVAGTDANIRDVSSLRTGGFEFGASHVSESSETLKRKEGIAFGYRRARGTWDGLTGSWHADNFMVTLYDTAEYRSENAKNASDYWYRDSNIRLQTLHLHSTVYDSSTGSRHTAGVPSAAFSLNTEIGRSLPLTETFRVIPQAQLQASWLTGYNSREDGVSLHSAGNWSLIGRAGFDAVKKLDGEDSSIYAKASVLHEFGDPSHITASDGSSTYKVTAGGHATWYTVGAGINKGWEKDKSLYLSTEHAMGNGWEDAWELRAGFVKRF